jgi:hypothetical protein
MERGSDMHGPRIDEELDEETQGLQRGEPSESRAEEKRKVEEVEETEGEAEGDEPSG